MRREILKSASLSKWSEEMEIAINLVLSLLDDHMKKLEIGIGVPNTVGVTTPYLRDICDGNKMGRG